MDLEAIEMLVRSAMHQAGATALTELLRFPVPDQRTTPCACGQQARYRELRSKTVLTAVGSVEVSRPYYLCRHCHQGQFPADKELDVVDTEFSPGVRRMQAVVGQDTAFDHGREQMKLLAGLEVTTKSVERVAETIGADIARCEEAEIDRAVQLDLPIIVGDPVPILYIQMDGTGVPVVKKETVGRKGKLDGLPAHTREAKLGCVFTQTTWDDEGFAIRDPDSTTYTGAIENAEQFGNDSTSRPGNAAGAAPRRRSLSGTARNGSGISRKNTFPVPLKSSIYSTHASICGNWRAYFIPTTPNVVMPGSVSIRNVGLIKARSPNWLPRSNQFKHPMPIWRGSSATKPTTLPPTRLAWRIPNSVSSTCSLGQASSKPVARRSSVTASNNLACFGR